MSSRRATCRRCGQAVRVVRLAGIGEELELDRGQVWLHPRRPKPGSLFVESRVQGEVERVEAEISRRLEDGTRGPFLVRHSERCPR